MNIEGIIKLLHRITDSRDPADWEKSLYKEDSNYVPLVMVANILGLAVQELKQQLDVDGHISHLSFVLGLSENEIRQRLGLAPPLEPEPRTPTRTRTLGHTNIPSKRPKSTRATKT
jgi:hypothetical protein